MLIEPKKFSQILANGLARKARRGQASLNVSNSPFDLLAYTQDFFTPRNCKVLFTAPLIRSA
ncbi:hypothetical protein GCM10027347_14840 [Larkinella harenae]